MNLRSILLYSGEPKLGICFVEVSTLYIADTVISLFMRWKPCCWRVVS